MEFPLVALLGGITRKWHFWFFWKIWVNVYEIFSDLFGPLLRIRLFSCVLDKLLLFEFRKQRKWEQSVPFAPNGGSGVMRDCQIFCIIELGSNPSFFRFINNVPV